jgi:hypothetical protein
VGVGLTAGSRVDAAVLAGAFLLPLLLSFLVAVALASLLYLLFRWLRCRFGISEQTCFCVGSESIDVVSILRQTAAFSLVEQLSPPLIFRLFCGLE